MAIRDEATPKVTEVKVMSRAQAETFARQRHAKTSAIVSIRSTWDRELAHLPMTKENKILAVCPVAADDEDAALVARYGIRHEGLMSVSTARAIARFCEAWHDEADMLVVHCDGGVSRSAGVAAAILRWFDADEYAVFRSRSKCPNMWCYNRVLDAFRGICDENLPQTRLEAAWADEAR